MVVGWECLICRLGPKPNKPSHGGTTTETGRYWGIHRRSKKVRKHLDVMAEATRTVASGRLVDVGKCEPCKGFGFGVGNVCKKPMGLCWPDLVDECDHDCEPCSGSGFNPETIQRIIDALISQGFLTADDPAGDIPIVVAVLEALTKGTK